MQNEEQTTEETTTDIELPEVPAATYSRPRVHISDNACVACEG